LTGSSAGSERTTSVGGSSKRGRESSQESDEIEISEVRGPVSMSKGKLGDMGKGKMGIKPPSRERSEKSSKSGTKRRNMGKQGTQPPADDSQYLHPSSSFSSMRSTSLKPRKDKPVPAFAAADAAKSFEEMSIGWKGGSAGKSSSQKSSQRGSQRGSQKK
jgi:hypothetical protein